MIPVSDHYNRFLGKNYLWICGSAEEQVEKNRGFFSSHSLLPEKNTTAIDLGAGCGFQSVPLAELGYTVLAVDFCRPLLDDLHTLAGTLPVRTLWADILDYASWAGQEPALIVCMGDTLTHLPSAEEARDLIRQCFLELAPGGRLVLGLRNYSGSPSGTTDCIPVRRDKDRIFLCRLAFRDRCVDVTDILYSSLGGTWQRASGSYTKIRISHNLLEQYVRGAGFTPEFSRDRDGILTIIAVKPPLPRAPAVS